MEAFSLGCILRIQGPDILVEICWNGRGCIVFFGLCSLINRSDSGLFPNLFYRTHVASPHRCLRQRLPLRRTRVCFFLSCVSRTHPEHIPSRTSSWSQQQDRSPSSLSSTPPGTNSLQRQPACPEPAFKPPEWPRAYDPPASP